MRRARWWVLTRAYVVRVVEIRARASRRGARAAFTHLSILAILARVCAGGVGTLVSAACGSSDATPSTATAVQDAGVPEAGVTVDVPDANANAMMDASDADVKKDAGGTDAGACDRTRPFRGPTAIDGIASYEDRPGAGVAFTADELGLFEPTARGNGYEDLSVRYRPSTTAAFGPAKRVIGPPVSVTTAWVSRDGLRVDGSAISVGGIPADRIFTASRAAPGDPFGAPAVVVNNPSTTYALSASLPEDELEVFFDRSSSAQILVASRANSAASFGPPASTGVVGTRPVASADGLELYYRTSVGHVAVTTRPRPAPKVGRPSSSSEARYVSHCLRSLL